MAFLLLEDTGSMAIKVTGRTHLQLLRSCNTPSLWSTLGVSPDPSKLQQFYREASDLSSPGVPVVVDIT